jgi:cytochrome P450
MGLLGFPLADWVVHNDAAHKQIYTPPSSPQYSAVMKMVDDSREAMAKSIRDVRAHPRPGLINALINGTVDGKELSDVEITGTCGLLVGGGFDTTTALTGQALLWLSIHPDRRKELTDDLEHLLDPATEEFLRFFTPAQGDARTFSQDVEIDGIEFKEGERLWLSWAMANRSPGVFTTPDEVDLHRRGNRHASFGLGIHRCIGSNLARTMFKRMITAVLERMPDFTCDPNAVVHYESVAVINGLVSLPATFTPGTRRGAGLAETLAHVETIIAKEQLAEPVARRHHQ